MGVIREAALRSQNHFSLRLLAEDICQHLRSKDYLSEILAINNFAFARTRYMRDPRTIELVKAPYLIAEEIQRGRIPQIDCDEETALIAALLLSVGCEARAVTVAFRDAFYNGERQYSHVFAQGKEPRSGAWITLDPVAGTDIQGMLRRVVAAKTWPIA